MLALLDPTERKERGGMMAYLVHVAPLGNQALLDFLAHLELMVKMEMMEYRVHLVDQVHQEVKDSQERGAHKVPLDLLATQVPLVPRVHLVQVVHVV
jgi:hypothetical protein